MEDALSAAEAPPLDETRTYQLSSAFVAIRDNIQRVVRGKQDVVEQILLCLLAGGHLLIEDVPGVG
jgi:MoxR-like ATPase